MDEAIVKMLLSDPPLIFHPYFIKSNQPTAKPQPLRRIVQVRYGNSVKGIKDGHGSKRGVQLYVKPQAITRKKSFGKRSEEAGQTLEATGSTGGRMSIAPHRATARKTIEVAGPRVGVKFLLDNNSGSSNTQVKKFHPINHAKRDGLTTYSGRTAMVNNESNNSTRDSKNAIAVASATLISSTGSHPRKKDVTQVGRNGFRDS